MADNRSYVYRRLRRELGLTPAQAAGAVGGLGGESGRSLDPNAVNPTSGALGIGQWLGGRKQGVQKGNLRQQTDHLIAELKGPERSALNRLRGSRNINDATRAWVEGFERPSAGEIRSSMPARLGYARDAFKAFGSGGGGAGGGGGGAAGGSTVTTQSGSQAPPDFGSAQSVLPLLQALTESQKGSPASAGVAPPAFTAQAALPSGYQPVSGGGGPAPPPDISKLAAAVQTLGAEIPATQMETPAARTDAEAGVPDQGRGFGSYGSGRGKFKITGPNPGRIQPQVRNFMSEISGVLGGETVVGSDGTGHSKMTVNGNVSEHYTGAASDIPAAGDQLMKLGRAALIAAGMDPKKARKAPGGLYNVTRGGKRYQIIFNTQEGGDHTDHLHVGVSRRR